MNRIRILALVAMLAMIFGFANVSPTAAQAGTVFYVKQAATGSGDGLSWANATTLQDALGSAASGDEIWVAKGLYKPTGGTDKTVSFMLVPGVAVYGGFDPDNGADTFGERDWVANPTVLSGDLDGNDITDANGVVTNWANINITDGNSIHVVVADGSTGAPITNSTILDGFIITAGYANGGGTIETIHSGGFYCSGAGVGNDCSPSLTNVTFSGNRAQGDGGAMFNDGGAGGSSSPTLTNVTFFGNKAGGYGGGMYNGGGQGGSSSPTLSGVTFDGNVAGWGGGMYNDGHDDSDTKPGSSSPSLTNVNFANNSAEFDGGAMVNDGSYSAYDGSSTRNNSSPTLNNVTFTNNSAGRDGGAMFNDGRSEGRSSPILIDVTFTNNGATLYGGAMYNDGSYVGTSNPTLTDVAFDGNSGSRGGAMYNKGACSGDSSPILNRVTFSNNSATNFGGAMYNEVQDGSCASPGYSNPILSNVAFSNNSATNDGGAIYNNFVCTTCAIPASLTNVSFSLNSANQGGAIYNNAPPSKLNDIDYRSTLTLTNVIFWGDSATGAGAEIYNRGADLTISYSVIEGGVGAIFNFNTGAVSTTGTVTDGGNNLAADPLFVNQAGGDLQLAFGSSAIDTGDDAVCPATDLAGTSRPRGGQCEIGAYEYIPVDFIITVKTDNSGSSTSTQFKIPTTGSGYNYNVDCNNDGTNEVTGHTSSTGYTCEYGPAGLNTGAGTYTIRIQDNTGIGTGFPRIYFAYSGDRLKLLDVRQWGSGKWTSMNNAFSGCNNLGTFSATDSPDLSNVTDMSFMFTSTWYFSADLSSWDTGNVTDMSYMFQDTNFDGDLSTWDTSSVVNMSSMFEYTYDFNQDIGAWDTGNVTNMSYMFYQSNFFNQDIGGWNTGNVTNMSYMFYGADTFNQDIGAWNTTKVTNMSYMFYNDSVFNQDLGAWTVANLTNATNMFAGAKLSTANYDALLIGWDAQTLRPNVPFNGGWSKYCAGEAARANMISSDGWNITDLGKATCFTVTFDANGGTGTMSPQTSDVAANLTSNTFTRTGYTFTGWNTAADGSGTSYADTASYPFTADAILYAQWSSSTSIYTVTFNANGGTGTMTPQTSSVAANLTANAFTRTGYTFTGWNTAANGSGTSYADSASYPFTVDATLYAQWSINTYTVTFDANGGTGTMSNQTGNYNVAANLTANAFTRTGYTFTGWNTAADGSGTAYADGDSYPFTADATLYAQWSNTLVGSNVEVQPVDTTSGTEAPVTLTFDQITQAGTTSLTTSSTGTPPPAGFQLGNPPLYYDLSTTALFAGQVEVCIDYTGTSFTNEANLQLHHYENGAWVDRTISLDTTNNIICASVTSFSEFGTFETVNEPPAVAANSDPVTVNEGDTATNSGTVSDPDADTVTLTASVGSVVNNDDGTWSWSLATSDGPVQSQAITIDADDGNGGTASTTFDLIVDNVAPTASLGNNGPIDEGGSATINFSGASDPSSDDTAAGFHYAFDCDGGSLSAATYAGSGTSDSTSCAFADDGTYTASGKIMDKDGGSTEYTTVVTVNNVAPGTIIIAKDQSPDGSNSFGFSSDIPGNAAFNVGGDSSLTLNNVPPGSYAVTEDDPAAGLPAFALTGLSCDDDGSAAASTTDVGTRTATVNLEPGETVTCTFTNTRLVTIIAFKYNDLNQNGNRDAGDGEITLANWEFTLYDDQGTEVGSGVTIPTGDNRAFLGRVLPGTYTVCETPQAGWLNSDPGAGTVADPQSLGRPCKSISFVAGATTVNALFGNFEPSSTITIIKDTVPDAAQDFAFTTTGGLSPATFNLDDDDDDGTLSDTQTFSNIPAGSYTVAETAAPGYTTSISCVDPTGNTTTLGATATIDVAIGETVTCIFTNLFNQPPVANNESYTTNEDTALVEATVGPLGDGVLANDTDADSDPLTAVLDTTTTNGVLALNSDGSFTYTPNADFCGADSFTYHANDGTVDSNSATVDIDVVCVDDPPVVSVDMTTQSVQYSDRIADVTVTATDTDSASLNTSGSLPDNLSLSGGCTPSGAGSTCSWTLAGQVLVSAGTYDIALTVSDATTGVRANTQVVVTPEDADVSLDSDNPVAVRVAQDGGNSGPFSLTFYVRETQPDQPTNSSAAGKLSPDDVSMSLSMSLVPVGPGGSVGSTCTLGAVSGSGYDAFLPVTCQFADVEVNAYTVQVTIDGGYYVGAGEDVVTVYDPSLGFATGGGWFYWPGTGDRTNFGFTMKYNKKVTKVQGNLLLIRHMPDGSIYRVKSNALEGLALGEDPSVPMGWASFSGKSTYQEPGWPEPQGNYEFVVYVEDWDEPGTGVDRFWIEVKDKSGAVVPAMSMDREATDNTVQLSGGNIAVPHGGGGKK